MNAPLKPHQHKELLAIEDALTLVIDRGLRTTAHYRAALRHVEALLAKQRAHLARVINLPTDDETEPSTTTICPDCCGFGVEDSASLRTCLSCCGTGIRQ